jgi:hypothetical protein
MAQLLYIAADPQLLASLAEQFEALGGYAIHALDLQALEALRDVDRDAAAIVDGDFCDAPTLARRLRAKGVDGTLIVIGAAPAEADASLARPFRFADLLSQLARPRTSPAPADMPAGLTEKEAAILSRLLRADGAIIPKAALLADVWGYGPNVSTRTLETHIHRLRRKIEPDPKHPRKLLTEEGGYRLAKFTG